MLYAKVLLSIVVSVIVLVIAVVVDKLCKDLPIHLQFLVQVPIIILVVDALRNYVLDSSLELSDAEINACFFMASPMVSIGSVSLYSGIKALL
jgi:hypothetical protein